jgi:hypothetical protein
MTATFQAFLLILAITFLLPRLPYLFHASPPLFLTPELGSRSAIAKAWYFTYLTRLAQTSSYLLFLSQFLLNQRSKTFGDNYRILARIDIVSHTPCSSQHGSVPSHYFEVDPFFSSSTTSFFCHPSPEPAAYLASHPPALSTGHRLCLVSDSVVLFNVVGSIIGCQSCAVCLSRGCCKTARWTGLLSFLASILADISALMPAIDDLRAQYASTKDRFLLRGSHQPTSLTRSILIAAILLAFGYAAFLGWTHGQPNYAKVRSAHRAYARQICFANGTAVDESNDFKRDQTSDG